MRTMTFAAGLAAGYVLGAKAGRDKYEQITAAARWMGDQPMVSQTQAAMRGLAENTGQVVASKIASLMPDTSDSNGSATTGATTAKPRATETHSAPPPTPTPTPTSVSDDTSAKPRMSGSPSR
jgi:hypothetical protein